MLIIRLFIILRYVCKDGSRIIHSNGCDFSFPDVWQLSSRTLNDDHSRLWTWFFPPNCSKFAIESDWNCEISRNVQNLSIFGKIDGFFSEKNLIFSETLKVANCFWNAYHMVILRRRSQNFQIFFFGKIERCARKNAWNSSDSLSVANIF